MKISHAIAKLVAFSATVIWRLANADVLTDAPAVKAQTPVKNVVLVHGLFADGSSWNKVIPLLQKKGLHVTAVQNPTTSFPDDVEAVRRVIELQDGPTILVGHSYGGMVISEAGLHSKVAGLVFIAARAPAYFGERAHPFRSIAPTCA